MPGGSVTHTRAPDLAEVVVDTYSQKDIGIIAFAITALMPRDPYKRFL